MGSPFELFTKDPAAIAISVGILLFVGIMFWMASRRRKKPKVKEDKKAYAKAEEQRILAEVKQRTEILQTQGYQTQEEKLKIIQGLMAQEKQAFKLGTGVIKTMVFCPGNIVNWTTMPKPIGEMYQADTSCPLSGGIYMVKQLETGEIVDYDPREVAIVTEETPEYAWFATHWQVVRRVFALPLSWFRNPANWYAAAALAILFISIMVVVGD